MYINLCLVKEVESLERERLEKSLNRSRTEDFAVCIFASPPRKEYAMMVRLVWDADWVEVGSLA